MKKAVSFFTATLIALFASLSAFAAGDTLAVSSEQAASKGADTGVTLLLMLKGMLGIFVVMGLIYLVVIILNKVSAPKKDVKDDSNNGK